MERVTRHQIEQAISDNTHITVEAIHSIIDQFIFNMHLAFAQGLPVVVTNLGTFKLKKLNTGNGTYVVFSRSGPDTMIRQRADAMAQAESEVTTET